MIKGPSPYLSTCWSPAGDASSLPAPAGGEVELGLAGARTFSSGSPPLVVKLPALESKNDMVNMGPRIRMRDPLGLTTTGSFILGSPRSGRLMMTTMTDPRVVPMKSVALSMWSFLMAKESTNSTAQTPSCWITWKILNIGTWSCYRNKHIFKGLKFDFLWLCLSWLSAL